MDPSNRKPLIKCYLTYLSYCDNVMAYSSVRRYVAVLDNFLCRFKDRKFPDEIHRWDIQDFMDARGREGVSNVTRNYEVRVLGTFWRWMIDRELADHNPVDKIKKVPELRHKPKGLSAETVNKLLSVCYSTRDKLLILLPLTTGLRTNELINLTWDEIDFENHIIQLSAEKTKGRTGRIVPLRSDVEALLKLQLAACPVAPFNKRRPYTVYLYWKAICTRAGLKLSGLHCLRHTFATMLLRNGTDIITVKELLGHSDLKTTLRYVSAADNAEVMKTINTFPRLVEASIPIQL